MDMIAPRTTTMATIQTPRSRASSCGAAGAGEVTDIGLSWSEGSGDGALGDERVAAAPGARDGERRQDAHGQRAGRGGEGEGEAVLGRAPRDDRRGEQARADL